MDTYVEIKKYVEAQVDVFCMMPINQDFNKGVIEGLNLVKAYIDRRIEDEATKIAEALDGK